MDLDRIEIARAILKILHPDKVLTLDQLVSALGEFEESPEERRGHVAEATIYLNDNKHIIIDNTKSRVTYRIKPPDTPMPEF